MSSVVQDSNEKHLAPWSAACSNDQIANTPLSPYLDKVSFHLSSLIFAMYILIFSCVFYVFEVHVSFVPSKYGEFPSFSFNFSFVYKRLHPSV